jgi:hypothetical protein
MQLSTQTHAQTARTTPPLAPGIAAFASIALAACTNRLQGCRLAARANPAITAPVPEALLASRARKEAIVP